MKPFLPAIICLTLLFGCASNEIGNSKDVNPDTIYTGYEIRYTEGDEMVECIARFRFAGKNGTTLVLTNPSKIELDGIAMPVDSSNAAGAYYHVDKPFNGFEGKHSLVFTDINGKTYDETFTFKPFKLDSAIPAKAGAEGLPVTFEGLADGSLLHVEAADTSLDTEDISRIDTVKNGGILLSAANLAGFKNGPVNMEFYIDTDIPLENATKEGGKLNLVYKLKQQRTMLKK